MKPDTLADLHAQCFPDRPWSAAEFRALLDDRATLCLHRADAFVIARLLPPEAEILTLATAPAARRQGHGRHLLRDLLAQLAARDISDLFLEVAADNTAARALYAQVGFTQAGQRKGYYARTDGARADALILRRKVNADPALAQKDESVDAPPPSRP